MPRHATLVVLVSCITLPLGKGYLSTLDLAIRQQFITAIMDAAMAAFHHANFLSRPSMFTCQAIAILGLCGHNVCDSDLLSSLLAIGIKHAQALGLHTLAKRRRGMSSMDLEMGRRVWWSLTMEDWYAIPFRGVWCKYFHSLSVSVSLPTSKLIQEKHGSYS